MKPTSGSVTPKAGPSAVVNLKKEQHGVGTRMSTNCSLEDLETKESSLYKDLRKEIDSVRDLAKKVKTEVVRESVNRINDIFGGKLTINRRERSVL